MSLESDLMSVPVDNYFEHLSDRTFWLLLSVTVTTDGSTGVHMAQYSQRHMAKYKGFAVDLIWGSPRPVSQSSRLLSHNSRLLSRYRTAKTKVEKHTPRPAQNTKKYQNRPNNGGER